MRVITAQTTPGLGTRYQPFVTHQVYIYAIKVDTYFQAIY